MLVPDEKPYPPSSLADLIPTPGAATFGFKRKLLSTTTGPLLLKPAMVSLIAVAPTLKLPSNIAAGVDTVPQLLPEFPAETTTTLPAALRLLITRFISSQFEGLHPSTIGHDHELLITCGALEGSGFLLFKSVGPRNH